MGASCRKPLTVAVVAVCSPSGYIHDSWGIIEDKLVNQKEHTFGYRWMALHWIYPAVVVLVAIVYPFGPSQWMHTNYHGSLHQIVEIVFYAATGPLAGYWALMRIGRWLEEGAKSTVHPSRDRYQFDLTSK